MAEPNNESPKMTPEQVAALSKSWEAVQKDPAFVVVNQAINNGKEDTAALIGEKVPETTLSAADQAALDEALKKIWTWQKK